MRLTEFIDQAKADIVAESIAYAAQIPAFRGADPSVLRNHIPHILDVIVHDLKQPQSEAESIEKSLGRAPASPVETAAQSHGTQRARAGLSIEQVVAEYRVMRSSVLRLWAEAQAPDKHVVEDTLRFNEAIDQAVAESVEYHAAENAQWRDIVVGVLGHDLRGPLNAMLLTTELLVRETEGTAAGHVGALLRNGRRLADLLDSLLEYTRSTLGVGMTVHRQETDLDMQCQEEIEIIRRAVPHRQIDFRVVGDTHGAFDGSRVREALSNLVFNAAQHSPPGSDIVVAVTGGETAVELSTENATDPIPPETMNMLFEPFHRRAIQGRGADTNLGLGLFIVREIARAHQGVVTATVADGRIRFKLVLPKRAGAA